MDTYSIREIANEMKMDRDTVTRIIQRIGCQPSDTDDKGNPRYRLKDFQVSFDKYNETKPKRREVPTEMNDLLIAEMQEKVRNLAIGADLKELELAEQQKRMMKTEEVLSFLQIFTLKLITHMDRLFDNKLPIAVEGLNKSQLRGKYENYKNEVRDMVIASLEEWKMNMQPVKQDIVSRDNECAGGDSI